MNELIVRLISVFNELDTRVDKQTWEEKIYRLTANFKGLAKDFTELFQNPLYVQLLEGTKISFEFIYDGPPIRNYEYIEYIEAGLIPEDSEITLTISLNKENLLELSQNTLLFFKLDTFKEVLQFENPDFISFLKKYDNNKNIDIFLPIEETITNDLITIFPLRQFNGQVPSYIKEEWKEKIKRIKEDRDDLSRVAEFYPIPNMFKLQNNVHQIIKQVFNTNLFYLSLLHIANKTKEQTFIIRGQKNLEINWDTTFIPAHADILFQIFKFSFGQEQTEDKLEITRNIITIYLHEENLQALDLQLDKMKQTIERHFSLYVQDKIKKFFDDTKDAIELARKYALEAKEAADKIVGNINTAIIALITAVFSGIVIMSRGNYMFFIAALSLHILYFILSFGFNRHFALKKKDDILQIYDLTNDKFANISDEEKKEIKKEYVEPALKTIDTNLKKYGILSLTLITIMVLLMFGARTFSEQLKEQPIKKDVVPEQKEKVVPEQKEKVVPEQKEIVVPEQKEKVVPEQKEKVVPEQKEKVVPEQKEIIVPEQKEIIVPKEPVPERSSSSE
ncbi:hypothetical protein P4388_10235 [Bacillus thuringiensis]|uniref:hypothetical protein n=1 Tax=Bacillus thuringiensis TaxID=1428 RepID=UPI000A3C7575|nr:hypothetical protein [Bacillus thuringiensis]MED3349007.1 hypothetical protein [Bacillus thuringiensis]MRB11104.1 hypothetical protein [Bacillus thuringiensis]OTW91708.1 hypothetical protein BK711_28250 [Bacillus thuringiensis serovar fukuokaensis]